MTPTRFLPAAAGVVLTAMLVVVPAAPAMAATANISISGPAPGSHLTSTSVAITGSANIDPGLLGSNAITDLNVAVTFENAPFDSCDNAGCGAGTGHASTNFSFSPKALARNGPYGVTANVTADEYLLGSSLGPTARTGSATTNFSVGVPPLAPRNVKAQVNSDNSVTVSWSANPEPDLIGYQIQRQDSASSAPHVVNSFLTSTSWTDTTTSATGGTFGYTVIAFRPGADGTATTNTVMHTSSSLASATVAAPIPVTTTLAPGAGTQNVTTTTEAAPSVPAGTVDLSAFLAQATKAGAIPTPPPAAPVSSPSPAPRVVVPSSASSESLPALGPPDTYAPTLPYASPGASTASTAAPAVGGVPRVSLPGRPAASHQHRSLLFSIAGGLLLCVVGLVVRVANQRPDHMALEPVTGDDGGDPPVARAKGGAQRSEATAGNAGQTAGLRVWSATPPVAPAPRWDDASNPPPAPPPAPAPTWDPASAFATAFDPAPAPAPVSVSVSVSAPAPASDVAAASDLASAPSAAPATVSSDEMPVRVEGAAAAEGPRERVRGGGSRRPPRSGAEPAATAGEPGEYFRFILGIDPPANADHVEVPAPAG